LARHYLRMRQYTLTEVAFLLGFSEQSAFTRACKRWFDATPFEMRGRLRSG
ncbi:MAG: helix-turn-helix domain-containing protein, partial [Pseudomonadota bacterium]